MPLEYQAAVLHEPGTPLRIETIVAADLQPTDVLVRIRAAGLCHTDSGSNPGTASLSHADRPWP